MTLHDMVCGGGLETGLRVNYYSWNAAIVLFLRHVPTRHFRDDLSTVHARVRWVYLLFPRSCQWFLLSSVCYVILSAYLNENIGLK